MVTTIKREDFCFLVVDDFSTMRRIISGLLRELGFRKILEAEDGQVALRTLELAAESGEPVHFVLSDINMPAMNGLELLKQLRQLPNHDSTPVLLISAEDNQQYREQGKALGADGFLIKPFKPYSLKQSIDYLLQHPHKSKSV